jgi:hypothetical protein
MVEDNISSQDSSTSQSEYTIMIALPTDFHPGWSILENITEAITKSYKVFLILIDQHNVWLSLE